MTEHKNHYCVVHDMLGYNGVHTFGLSGCEWLDEFQAMEHFIKRYISTYVTTETVAKKSDIPVMLVDPHAAEEIVWDFTEELVDEAIRLTAPFDLGET